MTDASTTPLLKLAHDLATDEDILQRFIATEPNGPSRLKFLSGYGLSCNEIAAVQLAERDNLQMFMHQLGDEIRDRFRELVGITPTVAWPGSPLVLESIEPATLDAGKETTVVATGYFFGNDAHDVQLRIGAGPSFRGRRVRERGYCGHSTAMFTVRPDATGTFDVSIVRVAGGATFQSEIPEGLRVK